MMSYSLNGVAISVVVVVIVHKIAVIFYCWCCQCMQYWQVYNISSNCTFQNLCIVQSTSISVYHIPAKRRSPNHYVIKKDHSKHSSPEGTTSVTKSVVLNYSIISITNHHTGHIEENCNRWQPVARFSFRKHQRRRPLNKSLNYWQKLSSNTVDGGRLRYRKRKRRCAKAIKKPFFLVALLHIC